MDVYKASDTGGTEPLGGGDLWLDKDGDLWVGEPTKPFREGAVKAKVVPDHDGFYTVGTCVRVVRDTQGLHGHPIPAGREGSVAIPSGGSEPGRTFVRFDGGERRFVPTADLAPVPEPEPEIDSTVVMDPEGLEALGIGAKVGTKDGTSPAWEKVDNSDKPWVTIYPGNNVSRFGTSGFYMYGTYPYRVYDAGAEPKPAPEPGDFVTHKSIPGSVGVYLHRRPEGTFGGDALVRWIKGSGAGLEPLGTMYDALRVLPPGSITTTVEDTDTDWL